jgi:hypothetical protein
VLVCGILGGVALDGSSHSLLLLLSKVSTTDNNKIYQTLHTYSILLKVTSRSASKSSTLLNSTSKTSSLPGKVLHKAVFGDSGFGTLSGVLGTSFSPYIQTTTKLVCCIGLSCQL